MNEFKEQHLEKKKAVIGCLESAERFLTEHEYLHEAEMIAAQRENLQNGEFSIAVVGEFSAGKSTFLNALMGERLLPSFTKETTATINFLRHKNKAQNGEGGRVFYNDGTQETLSDVDFAIISQYVSTESTSVDVAKSVSHLDLYLDSKFLEDNVTLVDTPGLNGIAEGHRELTEEQIEKSSAGIFLFDANQPGSRSDFEFLTELRKRVKSILFVLNKIDSIKSSEGETVENVIEKLKENYKQMYPEETTIPEIWAIAAYPALVARGNEKMDYRGKTEFTQEEKDRFERESRMKAFEDRLWKFLTQGEKAKSELMAPIDQLITQLGKIKDSRKAELDTLSGVVDSGEIEAQQLELGRKLAELEEQLNARTKDIKLELKKAQRDFLEEVKSECEQCRKRFESKVDNFVDIEDITPDRFEINIKTELSRIGETAYGAYCDAVQNIQSAYTNEITEELNETLSAELNVKLDNKLELPEYSIGLEQFEKKKAEIEAEIEKLRKEADQGGDDLAHAMEIDIRRHELEKKLEAEKNARDFYETNSMTSIPAPNIRTEQKEFVIKSDGILGMLRNVVIGKKHELRSVEVVDRTEYEQHMRDRQVKLERYEREIKDCETQLANLSSKSVTAAEKIAHRRAEALSKKRDDLVAFEENFANQVREKGDKQLRRQKHAINDYIETLSREFIHQCEMSFNKNKNAQAGVITRLVGGSIAKQIELNQKELELLSQKQNLAIAEKNERIHKINAELDEIKAVLSTALGIEEEINSIKTDKIMEIQI